MRRELRRLVRFDLTWAWLILFGLFVRGMAGPRDRTGWVMGLVACLLAVYWAHRAMMAEVEDQTIEHLGTLPISPTSVLLQIGLGSALAAMAYTLAGFLAAGWSDFLVDLELWARGATLAIVLGWAGAMGGFRFGESALSNFANLFWVGPTLAVGTGFLMYFLICLPLVQAIPAALTLGWVGALGIYSIWVTTGGQWVETLLPDAERTVRLAAVDAVLEGPAMHARRGAAWLTPDGISPLTWHQLRANFGRVVTWILWPTVFLVFIRWARGHAFPAELVHDAALATLGVGPLCYAMVVASQTSQFRQAGLWDDIAVTPLPARSVLLGHVLPGVVIVSGSVALFGLAFLFCGRMSYLAPMYAVGVVGGFFGGGLCGFLAGATTTGWKAGLLGVFFCWLSVVLCEMGGGVLSLFLPLSRAWIPPLMGLASLPVMWLLYSLGVARVRRLQHRTGA